MAGRAAADPVAAADPAVEDQPAVDLAPADKVGVRGQVATDPHLIALGLVPTARHLIIPVREATDRLSTGRGAKATVRRSTVRGPPPTVRLSIARGLPATGPRSIARAGTIGRLEGAPGKLIARHLTVRGANSGPSQIDLAEILARRRSAHDPRDLRANGRGRTGHDVTLDRHSTAAAAAAVAVAVGLTRIVRGGLGPMAGATGRPAIRVDRRGRSRRARQGRRTLTRASSSVKVTS